jgi:threonine dehydrogenase-like Zn-dependent dehydrogenase
MIQSGEIKPLNMVSHRVLIDDLAQVYKKFEAKEDGMQKVYVQTKFSAPAASGSPKLTRFEK